MCLFMAGLAMHFFSVLDKIDCLMSCDLLMHSQAELSARFLQDLAIMNRVAMKKTIHRSCIHVSKPSIHLNKYQGISIHFN